MCVTVGSEQKRAVRSLDGGAGRAAGKPGLEDTAAFPCEGEKDLSGTPGFYYDP